MVCFNSNQHKHVKELEMNTTQIETSNTNVFAVPAFGPVPPIVVRPTRRSRRPLWTRWFPTAH